MTLNPIDCMQCADNSGKGLIGTGSSSSWWVSRPIPVVVDVEVLVIVPHQLPWLFDNTTQEQHVITLWVAVILEKAAVILWGY